ncbi:hypothetical protein BDZ90DRAFT_231526 [Jaminaea rosea]|uniref:Ribosomal protein L19 n=1 Tax=Jaminaea rosea TaxID=1569628 RepID=A0A316UTF7_9BASI|nr:hypothetical protein BDZ90DRAFT_231526 [Jaminaea rosea]PWN28542.1 hypothetical protein BDZ90DRAFT_231526 [Jaminaea rosea]
MVRATSSRSLTSLMRSMALEVQPARPALRSFSTSRCLRQEHDDSAEPVASSSKAPAYPYSSHSRVPSIDPSPFTPAPKTRSTQSGVMDYLHHQLRSQFDPADRLTRLFHRRSPEQIPVGSVLIVESWTSPAKTGMTTFSGVLMAIRRRGTSTSFVLRNLVQKLGVEMRFNLYSPLLKDVRVVARADVGKGAKNMPQGSIRRVRRAKLYYLRKGDNRIAGIGRMIKSRRQQQEKEAREAGATAV